MKNLIKFIVAVVALCLFSSCKITEKQRREICNTCVTKDSVSYKEKIILKDTIIYRTIKGEAVYIASPCDTIGNLIFKPMSVRSDGIKTSVSHIGNILIVKCDVDSLKEVITGLVQKEKILIEKTNETKYIPCLNEKTKFDNFTFYWFWITFCLLFIFVVIKVIKSYLKI